MLAIIIPYYKLIFFEETLQSLSNQTDKRFKIYIGDDASPENPSVLLEKYKGKFEFTYQRFEENLGSASLTKQWERCIDLSQDEEWLMILGDDDVLGINVVEAFYKQLPLFEGKTNVVRFTTQVINGNNETITNKYEHPVWEYATDSYYRKFERISRSSLSEYIFTKKAYKKYGFYDYPLAWNSDDRAWLDFTENMSIYTINESIVYVRKSNINITGKRDNLKSKYLSSVEFNKFLILNKFNYYNKYQRIKIVRKYHLELMRIKTLNLSDYIFIFKYYFFNINLNAIKGFVKKYINI